MQNFYGATQCFLFPAYFSSWVGATQPPTVVRKMEAQSEDVRVAYTFFARLAPTCMPGWRLLTKISASELSRKFIKSAFLVGREGWGEKGARIFFGKVSCLLCGYDLSRRLEDGDAKLR